MAVHFTADTHFGDGRARSFYARPFASVAEMDATMARAWNAAVAADDEVWHLGDFARGAEPVRVAALLAALCGRKHLIVGNNDTEAVTRAAGWASVAAYAEIEVADTRLVLCHYPFRTWNGAARGAVNLHGHSHGRLKPLARQVDVGVDAWGFRPVTLQELLARPRRRAGTRAG